MNKIICGDALTVLRTLPDKCCRCCVTSPRFAGRTLSKRNGQRRIEILYRPWNWHSLVP